MKEKTLNTIKAVMLTASVAAALTGCQKIDRVQGAEPGAVPSVKAESAESVFTPGFDPFEYIKVTFGGLDSEGSLSCGVDVTDRKMVGTEVEPEKFTGLSNGDTVKIHVRFPGGGEVTKDYVVEGLMDVKKFDEVNDQYDLYQYITIEKN